MKSEFINLIKLSVAHRRKFIKLRKDKIDLSLVKIFIKFNIIKFIKFVDKQIIIFFNYNYNHSFIKIKMINKSTQRESIKHKAVEKYFCKNKQILIISTDKGFINSVECNKKKIGGIPIISLMFG